MKIINEYYLITTAIIALGIPLLFFLKMNQPVLDIYNITIYGNTVDASMLVYYLDRKVRNRGWTQYNDVKFNITLIEPPVTVTEDEEGREEIDKEVISFCGVEKEWMKFLDDSNLEYSLKEYGIYFGEMELNSDKNQFSIYSTQSSFFQSVTDYGLSNYAAKQFFLEFAKNINQTIRNKKKYSLQEMSTLRVVENIFPSQIKEGGVKYFSQSLGLDQKYIRNFILPVIWGNYLHQTNSLSTLYKLLPVYCYKRPQIGESLVLFQYSRKIKQKLLRSIRHVKLNFIFNKRLETYSILTDDQGERKKVDVILTQQLMQKQEQNQSVISNETLRTYIESDILFMFENAGTGSSGKQTSYYKTIIDGKIKDDHQYEQFFTIYLKYTPKSKEEVKNDQSKRQKTDIKPPGKSSHNPIFSITRVCAYHCKGYQNSVYILISKHKLSSTKTLNMFQSHKTVYFKKYYTQQSLLPSNKKLQENENVYKIYDIMSLTDSYDLRLRVVKEIAEAFMRKVSKMND